MTEVMAPYLFTSIVQKQKLTRKMLKTETVGFFLQGAYDS